MRSRVPIQTAFFVALAVAGLAGAAAPEAPATVREAPAPAAPAAGVVLPSPWNEALPADPFAGLSEFSTEAQQTCTLCLSQICQTPGALCGDLKTCSCRTCNGEFNCWKCTTRRQCLPREE